MSELTFSQAVIVAAVPTIIALGSGYLSNEVSKNQIIYQARMSERDLINQEGIVLNNIAYLIPVADNRAWANYFNCRKDKTSRFECASRQIKLIPEYTMDIVKEPLDEGY